MNGGTMLSSMMGLTSKSNTSATYGHMDPSGGGGMGGGGVGTLTVSRKRSHNGPELIHIARKVMKLNKEALDAALMQVFARQSELNIFEMTTLKKRGPALTQFLVNHSVRDPVEVVAAIQAEVPQHKEKVNIPRPVEKTHHHHQQQHHQAPSLPISSTPTTPAVVTVGHQPEIKLAGAGGIPVAISTTLPPAVARLSQQQGSGGARTPGGRHGMVFGLSAPSTSPHSTPLIPGGTPLDPCRTPDKHTSSPGGPTGPPKPGGSGRLSSSGPGSGARLDPADQIAEKAKQEAYVLQRVANLQREGLWFEKRLPKVAEPSRTKAHWDYLLEEMTWISTDFAQERKWKKAMARKIARAIQKHFQEKKQSQLRAEKAAEVHARKVASFMARGVKQFWTNVGKLVEFKQTTLLEEKKKQALDQHLSFIVGETEKFSSLVAESMNKPAQLTPASQSDGEFEPEGDWSDDEETIEREEKQVKPTDHDKEIELLQKESELSLDDILDQLPPGYLEQRTKEIESEKTGEKSAGPDREDSDFSADSDDLSSDDEATLDEQEAAEAKDGDNVDPVTEVKELEADNELSIEELKAKYGALGGGTTSRGVGGMDTPPQDDADVEMESEQGDSDDDEEDEDDNLTGSEDEFGSSESDVDLETDSGLSSLLTDPTNSTSSSLTADPAAASGTVAASSGRETKDEEEADKKMNDVAALAESIQPKGYTLESTSVVTPVPFLLQFPLREYQHVGLDWLVTMYERGLNGILADEMGLGKTIQTISLLAHLACEKGIWGPHLIVVPTSVLLNWEMELKKWAPGFKVLTYYGSIKERKAKRQGWTKPNSFHVCVTSYKLAVQDHQSFRRKAWRYLILDEAQNIKNFKSQRWQLLLNFNTERRLLLTGTPLQNNLNELWSLMHFLMPALFQSHSEFQAWFSHPMKDMIEGNSDYNETIVKRLHKVLRPFLLRRLKAQVEKQLPKKYEHVVMCRLSNRQKYLYDDFMSRTKTKETLASGTMLSVINILMQLRKVCNHPNLFEERATLSPFHTNQLQLDIPSLVYNALHYDVFKHVNLETMNLNLLHNELHMTLGQGFAMRRLRPSGTAIEELDSIATAPQAPPLPRGKPKLRVRCKDPKASVRVVIVNNSATNNNNKVVKTHAINIGNILVRQIICQGGIQGLNAKMSSPLTSTSTTAGITGSVVTSTPTSQVQGTPVQGIPVQLVQRDGSRSTIKFLASAPRVIVQKSPSGQVTSLIKLPAVISQASTLSPSPGSSIQSPAGTPLPVQFLCATPTLTSRLQGASSPAIVSTLSQSQTSTITTPSGAVLRVTGPGGNLVNLQAATNRAAAAAASNALTSAIVTVSSSSSSNSSSSTSNMNSSTGSSVHIDAMSGSIQLRRKKTQQGDSSKEKEPGEDESTLAMSLFVKSSLAEKRRARRAATLALVSRVNTHRLSSPCLMYGAELRQLVRINPVLPEAHDLVCTGYEARVQQLKDMFDNFLVYVPNVTAPSPCLRVCHPHPSSLQRLRRMDGVMAGELRPKLRLLHPITSAMCTQFPDPRLIQYDCGKLQSLDVILRKLKAGGHRVLIFTQMTRMLDVLEVFLNFHGHIYLRLDGTTKVEQRQVLMERFNMDPRIFCFILSTRSGGVGVNLTGADTVVFYDSDWNPTMDAQAQDRCHRIGQTRDVHIYRLISEKTIEENILRKANQKRLLGDLAIEGGNFTTAFFKSSTIHDLFTVDGGGAGGQADPTTRLADVLEPAPQLDKASLGALENALAAAEDATDVAAAKIARAEAVADLAEFDESIPVHSLDSAGPASGESKAEQEVALLMEQLSGVERWAVTFFEAKIQAPGVGNTEAAVAAAQAELEAVKRDWELDRLASARRDEARRVEARLEDRTELLTFSREDATNQVTNRGKRGNKLKKRGGKREEEAKVNGRRIGRRLGRRGEDESSERGESEKRRKRREALQEARREKMLRRRRGNVEDKTDADGGEGSRRESDGVRTGNELRTSRGRLLRRTGIDKEDLNKSSSNSRTEQDDGSSERNETLNKTEEEGVDVESTSSPSVGDRPRRSRPGTGDSRNVNNVSSEPERNNVSDSKANSNNTKVKLAAKSGVGDVSKSGVKSSDDVMVIDLEEDESPGVRNLRHCNRTSDSNRTGRITGTGGESGRTPRKYQMRKRKRTKLSEDDEEEEDDSEENDNSEQADDDSSSSDQDSKDESSEQEEDGDDSYELSESEEDESDVEMSGGGGREERTGSRRSERRRMGVNRSRGHGDRIGGRRSRKENLRKRRESRREKVNSSRESLNRSRENDSRMNESRENGLERTSPRGRGRPRKVVLSDLQSISPVVQLGSKDLRQLGGVTTPPKGNYPPNLNPKVDLSPLKIDEQGNIPLSQRLRMAR
uniref:Helicase domino n=1 Tax=Cacopsylla melanoneura TaxID=428564 RepID=A0A8D8UG36_9HEMI